jgi:hypothetical protein
MTTLTNFNFLADTDSAASRVARRALKDFYFPSETSNDRGVWNAAFNTLLPGPMQLQALSRYGNVVASYDLLNRPYALLQSVLGGDTLGIVQPSTVFSDAAGTVPKTVFGAGVAAMRSQSNALFGVQTVSGQRPLWARHPARGRVNRSLADTANITSGTGWGIIRVSRADAPDSATGQPATTVTANATDANGAYISMPNLTLAAGQHTLSAVVKGTGWFTLRPSRDGTFGDAAQAWFNLGTGVAGTVSLAGGAAQFTAVSATISAVGDGYQVSVTFTLASTTTVALRLYAVDGNASLAVTSGAAFRVEAPQIEAGASRTGYQIARASGLDVTETGQRNIHYLSNDLIDDALPHTLAAGTYSVARMDRAGYSLTENVVHAGGAFDLLGSTSRLYAVHLHNQSGGLLTTAQKALLQTVFQYAGQGATV